jgi:hypothetical protein
MSGFSARWIEKGKRLSVPMPAYSEDGDLTGDAVYELTPEDPQFEEFAKEADMMEEHERDLDA